MSEAADRARHRRLIQAAPGSGHDRIMNVLRVALPVAIMALVVFLALAPLTVGRDISFVLSKDRVAVAKERMRVTDAIYKGEDQKGQVFTIRAASAVQRSSSDPVVRLANLDAQIVLPDGPATLGAKTGRYDMGTQRVFADGPVLFKAADGYQIATRDVSVDLPTRKLASGGAVDGLMPLGRFSANHMSADLGQRTVLLEGQARLHIVQRQSRGPR